MPLAATPAPDTDPTPALAGPRALRVVRAVLLSAATVGLVGLALPQAPPSDTAIHLTASAVSGPTTVVPELAPLHGPVLKPTAKAPARASRTRPAIKKVPKTVARKTASWVRPSGAGVVSAYGMRWGRMHKGIDFAAGYGASIRSIGDGTVIGSGYLSSESGYGLITLIRHRDGIVSAYAHQSRTFVSPGERVKAGETIGKVGSSGQSTGPHLHFEIRTSTHGGQVNPVRWLRSHGVRI